LWCNRLQPNTGPDGTDDTYYKLGERTKVIPATGPATTYGYDQAGELTSVERPKEGETPEIKDTYAYNGEGLRASQTISGTTTYLTWDMTEGLPLILSDTTNSYIYGPGGLPVEQISSGGTVTYLHHDQQGSTRLLTGSTGTVTGKCTYGAYGTPTCEGTSTTPLGYDGQYTSSDTGLIYMRARVYDPATGQFLTVDPDVGATRAPYNYAEDNPLNEVDPFGRSVLGEIGNFLEPLNPVKYYEEEIESYENGCGYFASVAHGLEGAVVGPLDISGGGEEELGAEGAADLDTLVASGETGGGDVTAAGRSIESHGGQGTFPETTGNAEAKNALGQSQLEDILTAPGTRVEPVTSGNFAGGTRYIASDGRGATFSASGQFEYFGVYPPG